MNFAMSIKVKSHHTGFPVFCIASAGNNSEFLVGGGGGATKAGIKNSVVFPLLIRYCTKWTQLRLKPK
jgi:hypothetical protein